MHDTGVVLRAAQVGRVFEGDPRVAGFKDHRNHFAPQRAGFDLTVGAQLAALSLGFVLEVLGFECFAVEVVQVGHFVRGEERQPLFSATRFMNRSGIQLACACRGSGGVRRRCFAQIQEVLDVGMPDFQIGAHRAFALATLIDRNGGVVGDLEEGHHALAGTVGAFDVSTGGAHARPVVAQTPRPFAEHGVVLHTFEDVVQVVIHGGQVAAGKLRVGGAAVEQRRGGADKAEAAEQVVELDGACFAVVFAQGQSHRHAHEEGLRGFDAAPFDVDQIAVIDGLCAQVLEVAVAFGLERGTDFFEVIAEQLGAEQVGFDAGFEQLRELIAALAVHFALVGHEAEHVLCR